MTSDKEIRGPRELASVVRVLWLALAFVCLLLFALVLDELPSRSARTASPVSLVVIFQVVAGFLFMGLVAFLIHSMNARKNYRLCVNISWLLLLFVPIGTAVAAYSLYVLKGESAKALFHSHMPPEDGDRDLCIVSVVNRVFSALSVLQLIFLVRAVARAKLTVSMPPSIAILSLFVALLFLLFASASLFIGWAVPRRRFFKACRLLSMLNCLALPFGTAVGVFSLAVLKKRN